VASEMDRLIHLHDEHAHAGVPAHIAAAWLHRAFTQIHPFQDGNGRVARALASLVFIKGGFFPLVVNRDDRARYIEALEAADAGILERLSGLFAQIQKRSLTGAISHAADIAPAETVEQAVAATRNMLVGIGRIAPAEYLSAKETAAQLETYTQAKLAHIATTLNNDIAKFGTNFSFGVIHVVSRSPQELDLLRDKLGYGPNFQDYFSSRALNCNVGTFQSQIAVAFHSVGPAFRGLLAVVAYFTHAGGPPIQLSEDIFRISYKESADEVEKRFSGWLDKCLIDGLAIWRRTLV